MEQNLFNTWQSLIKKVNEGIPEKLNVISTLVEYDKLNNEIDKTLKAISINSKIIFGYSVGEIIADVNNYDISDYDFDCLLAEDKRFAENYYQRFIKLQKAQKLLKQNRGSFIAKKLNAGIITLEEAKHLTEKNFISSNNLNSSFKEIFFILAEIEDRQQSIISTKTTDEMQEYFGDYDAYTPTVDIGDLALFADDISDLNKFQLNGKDKFYYKYFFYFRDLREEIEELKERYIKLIDNSFYPGAYNKKGYIDLLEKVLEFGDISYHIKMITENTEREKPEAVQDPEQVESIEPAKSESEEIPQKTTYIKPENELKEWKGTKSEFAQMINDEYEKNKNSHKSKRDLTRKVFAEYQFNEPWTVENCYELVKKN